MERSVKGDIVLIDFPYSDFSGSKRRPALIVAEIQGDDTILSQITSVKRFDKYSVPIKEIDFQAGHLPIPSNARPNKLMTVSYKRILGRFGHLKESKIKEIEKKIIEIFTS